MYDKLSIYWFIDVKIGNGTHSINQQKIYETVTKTGIVQWNQWLSSEVCYVLRWISKTSIDIIRWDPAIDPSADERGKRRIKDKVRTESEWK